MELPVIHMNGTAPEALIEGYSAVYYALNDALTALHRATPNARDYYPIGEEATARAMAEHKARVASLEAVRREMQTIIAHVDDAMDARLTQPLPPVVYIRG